MMTCGVKLLGVPESPQARQIDDRLPKLYGWGWAGDNANPVGIVSRLFHSSISWARNLQAGVNSPPSSTTETIRFLGLAPGIVNWPGEKRSQVGRGTNRIKRDRRVTSVIGPGRADR